MCRIFRSRKSNKNYLPVFKVGSCKNGNLKRGNKKCLIGVEGRDEKMADTICIFGIENTDETDSR